MEYFLIKQTENGLHIEGFPDAVKVIRIDGPQSKRLADLALHKADLEFAWDIGDVLNY
jgi:hypothetical protein